MAPARFAYRRATTIAEALEMRASADEDARFLAGGQSLVPMMSLRLARPTLLVDLNPVDALAGATLDDGHVVVGAMTRQADLPGSLLARAVPSIGTVVGWIGHEGTRVRGTLGGSLCHADPAAELPALLLAHDAEVDAAGPGGTRRLAVDDLLTGHYETALADDELLTHVRVPVRAGWHTGFSEVAPRRSDFALAGAVASIATDDDGRVRDSRVVAFAVASRPVRLPAVEQGLLGRVLVDLDPGALAAVALEHLDPSDAPSVSASYRSRLAVEVVRRALLDAVPERLGVAA